MLRRRGLVCNVYFALSLRGIIFLGWVAALYLTACELCQQFTSPTPCHSIETPPREGNVKMFVDVAQLTKAS